MGRVSALSAPGAFRARNHRARTPFVVCLRHAFSYINGSFLFWALFPPLINEWRKSKGDSKMSLTREWRLYIYLLPSDTSRRKNAVSSLRT